MRKLPQPIQLYVHLAHGLLMLGPPLLVTGNRLVVASQPFVVTGNRLFLSSQPLLVTSDRSRVICQPGVMAAHVATKLAALSGEHCDDTVVLRDHASMRCMRVSQRAWSRAARSSESSIARSMRSILRSLSLLCPFRLLIRSAHRPWCQHG